MVTKGTFGLKEGEKGARCEGVLILRKFCVTLFFHTEQRYMFQLLSYLLPEAKISITGMRSTIKINPTGPNEQSCSCNMFHDNWEPVPQTCRPHTAFLFLCHYTMQNRSQIKANRESKDWMHRIFLLLIHMQVELWALREKYRISALWFNCLYISWPQF